MLFIIVERGQTDAVLKLGARLGILYRTVTLCRGTASTELLEYLGLGEPDRSLICFCASETVIRQVLVGLRDEFMLSRAGHGIAFSVPIVSVGGRRVYEMLSGGTVNTDETEAADKNEVVEMEYELIVTVVNRGYAETVMHYARGAGARGGTIVPARGTKQNDEADFLGAAIHPEKELVLILADRRQRHTLITAIADGAGLKSEGAGFSFALPVTDVSGFARLLTP